MPRRNNHTKEELRDMVIKAGQNLIIESGFAALSTRKIAKEIGYTVGTLYHFFKNYDDIILHINLVTLDDLKKFIASKTDKELNDFERIKKLADLYIEFSNIDYHRWSALFEYNLTQNEELPDWYKVKIDGLFEFIKTPLLNIVKDPLLAEKHSQILWASIHGICVLSLSKKLDAENIEATKSLADLLVTNYLSGLKSNHLN